MERQKYNKQFYIKTLMVQIAIKSNVKSDILRRTFQ